MRLPPGSTSAPERRSRLNVRAAADPGQQGVPPGGFSFGSGVYGGPEFVDAFNSRRGPSPYRLIEMCRGLLYAMVAKNRDGVTRIPLRLYADGSRVMGKPERACDPIRVSRHVGERMARSGLVSSAAVDQVYEIRNHPILDRLDNPDPYGYFDRKKILGLMVSYCDIVGQSFLVPEGNGWDYTREDDGREKGPPDFLWVLYSQYVWPIREAGNALVNYWQYFRERIPYEAAIRFRHCVSFRDAYGSGYSPTYAGSMYSDQEERYTAVWDQVLGIGPRPNMIVSAKDPLMPPGEDERQRFEQDLNRKTSGGNVGRVVVSRGAWDFLPVNYQQADLAAKEISEYDRDNLASIFGQPPTYYTRDSNLANLQAADEQFARNSVEPRCDSLASTLTWLVQKWDRRLFFRFDPAIQEDDESREKVVAMRLGSYRTTINQENEELKYPPVPWGDEPIMKQGDIPWSMLVEKIQQGIQQQQAAVESQKSRDAFELRDAEPEATGEDEQQQADAGADEDEDAEAQSRQQADDEQMRALLRSTRDLSRQLSELKVGA